MSQYPSDWDKRRKYVYKRDNYQCQRCGARGGPHGNRQLHAHHQVPIDDGGTHDTRNLVTVCHSCHEDIHGHRIPSNTTNQKGRSTRRHSGGNTNGAGGQAGTSRGTSSTSKGTNEPILPAPVSRWLANREVEIENGTERIGAISVFYVLVWFSSVHLTGLLGPLFPMLLVGGTASHIGYVWYTQDPSGSSHIWMLIGLVFVIVSAFQFVSLYNTATRLGISTWEAYGNGSLSTFTLVIGHLAMRKGMLSNYTV